MTKKRKYLRAIRTNVGVERRYQKDLDKLIADMTHSVSYWVESAYKANPPKIGIAMDALPSKVLAKKIEELKDRWIARFDEMAEKIASRFVESGKKATDAAMMSAFRDAGWTVQFKPTQMMKDAVNATIHENVALIKSVPQQYLLQVEGAVMRGFTKGYDLKSITDDIVKHGGVTRRRAAFIARDQASKLRATTEQARRIELGLYEAEWVHSSAGKTPRPSHVKAGRDKLRFDVRKGAYIDGEYILPAYLPNCHPGESEVNVAHGCMKLYRRRYTGELHSLVLDDGVVLQATPNHPILTIKGWKAIKDIDLGDNLVGCSYQGINILEANVKNSISTFDKLFDSAIRSIGSAASYTGNSALEFHGDSSDGDVDVVNVAGLLSLGIESGFDQGLIELILSSAYSAFNIDRGQGSTDEEVVALLFSSDRRVRSFGAFLSELRSQSRRANNVGSALPSNLDTLFDKALADDMSRYAVFFREFELAKSGDVLLCDELIGKLLACLAVFPGGSVDSPDANSLAERASRDTELSSNIDEVLNPVKHCKRVVDKLIRVDFSHYVYNLETVTNWYAVNGILTHNCRCTSKTILPF